MALFTRLLTIPRLAATRIRGRLTGPDAGRLRLCVVGVTLAVALMIVLTGVAIGLASQSTVQSEDVDYWITPEGAEEGSVVLPGEGTSLGSVHQVTTELNADDRIDYASPVLLEPVRLTNEGGDDAVVLVMGVMPATDRTVNGIPLDDLDQSYDYYNDGGYDGEWSGGFVATDAAIELLEMRPGDTLTARGDGETAQLSMVARTDATLTSGVGEVPTIVLPLAEAQTLVGYESADQADQILVSTNDPAVQSSIEGIYPNTDVVSRTGLSGAELTTSSLPLAMALSAFLVSVVVGILFVSTMMGLELTANRKALATLDAIGFSSRSRSFLVFSETLVIAILGGAFGTIVGSGSIVVLNRVLVDRIGVAVAQFEPILLGYGIAVAAAIGVLAAPYPIWLTRRQETLEVLGR